MRRGGGGWGSRAGVVWSVKECGGGAARGLCRPSPKSYMWVWRTGGDCEDQARYDLYMYGSMSELRTETYISMGGEREDERRLLDPPHHHREGARLVARSVLMERESLFLSTGKWH